MPKDDESYRSEEELSEEYDSSDIKNEFVDIEAEEYSESDVSVSREEQEESVSYKEVESEIEEESISDEEAKTTTRNIIPTKTDPCLWLLKCRAGSEKSNVIRIAHAVERDKNESNRAVITSAIYKESLPGYIYVEAFQKAHVRRILDKMPGIYLSSLKLVPRKEYVDVLSTMRSVEQFQPDTWVRVRKGKYMGDLAKVVKQHGDSVTVRLIPRISTGTERGTQKLFNENELRSKNIHVTWSGGYWVYMKERYKDGLLEKEMNVSSLTSRAEPTQLELEMFGEKRAYASNVEYNDRVTVISGELKGCEGTVQEVDHNVATVELSGVGTIRLSSAQLSKLFKEGEEVVAIDGPYKSKSGFVVGQEEQVTVVFDREFEVQIPASLLRSRSLVSDLIGYERPPEIRNRMRVTKTSKQLLYKRVKAISGQYTGKSGIVMHIRGSCCRVELVSNGQLVEIDSASLQLDDATAPISQTPIANMGRTPSFGGMTPHMNRTPAIGRTPLYKTPVYGSRTPNYRTPEETKEITKSPQPQYENPYSYLVGAVVLGESGQAEVVGFNESNAVIENSDGVKFEQHVESLHYVPPVKKDRVIITSGTHLGKTGILLNTSSSEYAIRLDVDNQIILESVSNVVKKAK